LCAAVAAPRRRSLIDSQLCCCRFTAAVLVRGHRFPLCWKARLARRAAPLFALVCLDDPEVAEVFDFEVRLRAVSDAALGETQLSDRQLCN